jgi:hypothetical protein
MVSRTITGILLVGVLNGCASQPTPKYTHFPEPRIQLNELRLVQVDCGHRDFQIAWLERQMSMPREEPQHIAYEIDWNRKAKELMWQIRTRCY